MTPQIKIWKNKIKFYIMRIQTGKIYQHLAFGITITNYHGEYRALIIDFAFWYVEIVFSDYKEDNK